MKAFENYSTNLNILKKADKQDLNNEFIISGIIAIAFIQFDFSWKLLKECLRYEGNLAANSGSPREILKAAYSTYPFIEERVWLDMLKARNDMTHIYDGGAAKKMVDVILKEYIPEFLKLQENLRNLYGNMN